MSANVATLGALLRSYRLRASHSQEELAERAGVSLRTVGNIECGAGHLPRRDTIQRLAIALALAPAEQGALLAAAGVSGVVRAAGPEDPAVGPTASAAAGAMGAHGIPPPHEQDRVETSSVPLPANALLGRTAEVRTLTRLLRRPDVRLVTIIGSPGVGKSHLSLEVGRRLQSTFLNGACFVPLEAVREPHLVASALAHALHLPESADQTPSQTLLARLKERDLLLLLDNFEQVAEAAPLLAELLAACPRIKVLVTSRVPLRVRAEHVVRLASLALPDPAALPPLSALTRVPAMALFLARAYAAAGFVLTDRTAADVAAICRALDGLPLALELAAARLEQFSPAALLHQLDHRLGVLTQGARDLPDRQRTLRDALLWSEELLSPLQRLIFRYLAYFAGSFRFEAAAAVCHMLGLQVHQLWEELTALVDANLLLRAARQGNEGAGGEGEADGADAAREAGEAADAGPKDTARFRMLQTIREFAREGLASSGALEAVARAHAWYYLRLVEEAQPQLRGASQHHWLARIEQEQANLAEALRWALERRDPEVGWRLGAACWRFWLIGGRLTEGRQWLEALLAEMPASHVEEDVGRDTAGDVARDTAGDAAAGVLFARAQVLNGAGVLASRQGDYAHARAQYEASLALRRRLGDREGISSTLSNLALMARDQGDFARADTLWRESLRHARAQGIPWLIALVANNLAVLLQERGEYATARGIFEECLEIYRAAGNHLGVSAVLGNLGELARDEGNYARATALLEECLHVQREVGDKRDTALSLENLGYLADLRGDHARAIELLEESVSLFRALGDTRFLAHALARLGLARQHTGDTRRAESLFAESVALSHTIGDVIGLAFSYLLQGQVAVEQTRLDVACGHVCESFSCYRKIGSASGMAQCLETLARIAHTHEQWERAVRLSAAATALRAESGAPLPVAERVPQERLLADSRAHMSEEQFVVLWEAPQGATREQIVLSLESDLSVPAQGAAMATASSPNRITEGPV